MMALVGKRIDLDMTPEEAFSSFSGAIKNKADYDRQQAWRKSMANIQYPFVDVWDFQAALAWMAFDSDGTPSRAERVDDKDREALGVTGVMLHAAIEEAGGGLNISGQYPISEEIKDQLQKAL